MSLTKIYAPFIITNAVITFCICLVPVVLSVLYGRADNPIAQDNFEYVSKIWVGTKGGVFGSLLLLWVPLMLAMFLHRPVRNVLRLGATV